MKSCLLSIIDALTWVPTGSLLSSFDRRLHHICSKLSYSQQKGCLLSLVWYVHVDLIALSVF